MTFYPKTAADFVEHAFRALGRRYIYGAEARLDDPNPKAFDCSELVEWALAQTGVKIPDGSMRQLEHCRELGMEISVELASSTLGALLFREPNADGAGLGPHVAISLGDGRTIEARGRAYGVVQAPIEGRLWTAGALVPGLSYPAPLPETDSGSSIRG